MISENREEMVDTALVNWNEISYRVSADNSKLEYGKHFQIYELLLADIVELIPTRDQKKIWNCLCRSNPLKHLCKSAEIQALGINTDVVNLVKPCGSFTKIKRKMKVRCSYSRTWKIYRDSYNTQ